MAWRVMARGKTLMKEGYQIRLDSWLRSPDQQRESQGQGQ